MTSVLVAVGSKHGGTAEIAQAIGDTIAAAGFDVTVLPVDEAGGTDGADAVVLGSAVYAGHWLKPAKEFVHAHAGALRTLPVWLFSSGPLDDKPTEEPVDAAPMIEATNAREHRVFAGRLDRATLGFGERALTTALRTPYGDYRPWDDIREWAQTIAAELRGGT